MSKKLMTLLAACAVAAIPLITQAAVSAEGEARSNQFWWPDQLDLSPLRQHAAESNPLGENFDYGRAFLSLDLNAVKQDIAKVLTTSQDWWPAALTGAADIASTGYRDLPEYRSNLPRADVFDELRAATVHTTATRHTLDLNLSLHDIPLHLLQNVLTLLKSKPDLLECDSTSATIEFCDLLDGESFASEAGFNPDDEFHGRLLGYDSVRQDSASVVALRPSHPQL